MTRIACFYCSAFSKGKSHVPRPVPRRFVQRHPLSVYAARLRRGHVDHGHAHSAGETASFEGNPGVTPPTDNPADLKLGTLSYRAVPMSDSVIVYSNALGRWGRVAIQEVKTVSRTQELWRLLRMQWPARWMLLGFVLAVVCMGLGLYGLGQRQQRLNTGASSAFVTPGVGPVAPAAV